MLIYNYQKEFVGMDDSSLKTLGFSNLSQLIVQTKDFADLFVKRPGYIHNFKHVHWIDFILCAEENEHSKVIININGKNFGSNLEVRKVFLKDDPNDMGYLVDLVNLKELTKEELEVSSKDSEQEKILKANTELDLLEDTYYESDGRIQIDI